MAVLKDRQFELPPFALLLSATALLASLGSIEPCYGSEAQNGMHFTNLGDPGIGDANSAHGMLAVDYDNDRWVDIYIVSKKRDDRNHTRRCLTITTLCIAITAMGRSRM